MEMKNDLLVCIAFHYSEDRLQYLNKVIDNLLSYDCPVTIIVDTNNPDLKLSQPVIVCSHTDLSHPFHLTWQHRKHIKENIDKYENYGYFEDDVLLPYENYLNYLENFKILWPNCVPAMIRIEEKDGDKFVTDIVGQQVRMHLLIKDEKEFEEIKAPNNYNGFWVMPGSELKKTLNTYNFNRVHQSREHAASYVAWELQKTTMLQMDNGFVSEKCYSYHLPNNYVISPQSPHGKLKPENIFI